MTPIPLILVASHLTALFVGGALAYWECSRHMRRITELERFQARQLSVDGAVQETERETINERKTA